MKYLKLPFIAYLFILPTITITPKRRFSANVKRKASQQQQQLHKKPDFFQVEKPKFNFRIYLHSLPFFSISTS